jgi:hypothetical protein
VDRHIPFFELCEACARPLCPLCSIIADRAAKYLDNLLFEHVSDRPFRRAFRAAGGFCAEHAAGLASYRDGLALAILYRDVLADKLQDAFGRKGAAASGACPVCVERSRIEKEYLGFLAEAHDGDPDGAELRSAFESGRGLCLEHFAALAKWRPRPPAWLIDFHRRRYASLAVRVDAFISLSSYGHQAEFEALSLEDKLVWKELVEALRKRV